MLGTSPGRADGVCGNVEFPFPGRLMGEAVAVVTGFEPDGDPWLSERSVWPLLDVVDEYLKQDWLAALAAHLGGNGSQLDGHRRARRFSVVRHLADLFDRYGVHRPAMLRAWAADEHTDGVGRPLRDDVAWQARLWRRLRDRLGMPSPAERLDDACARLRDEPWILDLPARLSLFGLTRLPASYLDVLRGHPHLGFDEVAASVAGWTPERAAAICGVLARDITEAAVLYGTAERAMLNHARGLEHHVMGSRNAMAAINLCLATGNIGRPGAGYGTITGQGNGQGGREHGQKCDQLPGQRFFHDPGAIEHVAGVWGVAPEEIPPAGVPIFRQLELMETGEIRGLLNLCSNPGRVLARRGSHPPHPRRPRPLCRDRHLPVRVGTAGRRGPARLGLGRERRRRRQLRRAGV